MTRWDITLDPTVGKVTVTATGFAIEYPENGEQKLFQALMPRIQNAFASAMRARNPIQGATGRPAGPVDTTAPVQPRHAMQAPNPNTPHPVVAAQNSARNAPAAQRPNAAPIRGAAPPHTPPSKSLMRRPVGNVPNVGAVQGPTAAGQRIEHKKTTASSSMARRLAPVMHRDMPQVVQNEVTDNRTSTPVVTEHTEHTGEVIVEHIDRDTTTHNDSHQ